MNRYHLMLFSAQAAKDKANGIVKLVEEKKPSKKSNSKVE